MTSVLNMAEFDSAYATQPARAMAVPERGWQTDPMWLNVRAQRRESDAMATCSSDSCSESDYIMTPQGSVPASPRTSSPWSEMSETGKRKLEGLDDQPCASMALPRLTSFLSLGDHNDGLQALSSNAKRRQSSSLSSPELSHRDASFSDDPIIRSLNHGRRPEKGLLSRPTGLGEANVRFGPMRTTYPLHDAQSSRSSPYQQRSSSREEVRRERAKPKGTHCNVKYLPEEMDFIRYHKIDLKETWHEVRQNFGSFQKGFSTESLSRQVQGLQGVHYRENYAIPSPLRKSNGRRLHYLLNGHVEARPCKVREQGEYKYMYGLLYLFPERAKDYTWVRPDHRNFAAELSTERMQAKAHAKREAVERGTWVERVEDNSCVCCEHEEREVSPSMAQPTALSYETNYQNMRPYPARL